MRILNERPMFNPDFYPTPGHIISKMLRYVSDDAVNFLEPSAGKGNIAEYIKSSRGYRNGSHPNVDVIECEPELCQILQGKEFPIVGHDWLEFAGVSYYDAILMNPPFSVGDKHLLKAWDFLHDGEIVCLLNSETLNNPCTADRVRLAAIIAQHGKTENLGQCFKSAERKTDVNVTLVYLRKIAEPEDALLWARLTEEKEHGVEMDAENMLAHRDELGNMQHYYDKANEHMLKAFSHIQQARTFMAANLKGAGWYGGKDYKEIIGLAFSKNANTARAEFARNHRRDSWKGVFERTQYRKWLDKKQADAFLREVETTGNVPFTAENIKGTLENVVFNRHKFFDQSCANVFDELTKHFEGNTVSEGWKSNASHKVNKRIVFPNGCYWDENRYGGHTYGSFRMAWGRSDIDIYNDLDRVLCVLTRQDFDTCHTIGKALNAAFDEYRKTGAKETESEFFEIKFWKKGTVHLIWKDQQLREDFNVKVSRGKRWLGGGNPDADKPKPKAPEPPKEPAPAPAAEAKTIVSWQDLGDGRKVPVYAQANLF